LQGPIPFGQTLFNRRFKYEIEIKVNDNGLITDDGKKTDTKMMVKAQVAFCMVIGRKTRGSGEPVSLT
jgi:hypothetical protein